MVESLVNESIIVNGTQVINDNMPIQPDKFIIVIAVLFVISLVVGFAFMIWAKMK
jgi:hypothetical protein